MVVSFYMTEPDQNSNQNPNPTPAPDPQEGADANKNNPDPIALAKRVGELEAENTSLKEYKQKADPVLETLYSDNELLAKATESHNRRLGIATPAKKDSDKGKDEEPSSSSSGDEDTRLAMINRTQVEFEQKVGIDKLPEDKKQQVRGMIGSMLKEMLDPKGNKTIPQVFKEVSLVKFPWYLEKAYYLINRDNDLQAASEKGKNEVLAQYEGDRGVMGSMPSGSVAVDTVTLSPEEKKTAAKMGVSEDKYLENKKQILALR